MVQTSPADTRRLLADTERAQADASDPTVSAWVSANAGAGKTHVLKRRVLRILLAGTQPSRILCLTYTKAAAAEMQTRVFSDLSHWATSTDQALAGALSAVLGRKPTVEESQTARKLFARAIETPGGLKVQTIHAFCERLLQRFPLEAGVPPGFSILDDAEAAKLRYEATDRVLTRAARNPASPLGRALSGMIRYAAGDGFDAVLTAALSRRDWLETASRLVIQDADGHAAMAQLYRRALGVRDGIDAVAIDEEMAGVVSPAALQRAVEVLSGGKSTDIKLAEQLTAAQRAHSTATRSAALQRAFLTAAMEPRSDRFITKAIQTGHPDVFETLSRARDRFAALHEERQGILVLDASLALLTVAGEVMRHYTRAKASRAGLDFDDLVSRTASLLGASTAADWVLYKLDGGLDHILVDEAQDTSPVQWQVIRNLAQEFFSGAGARDEPRTIFAVGDEKQSIYSFQGAEPRMFAQTGNRFRQSADEAHLTWRTVPLTLSFRTVEPLLRAVDRVFSDPSRTPGITAGDGDVRHLALRIGHAGCVEIWDTEKPRDTAPASAWRPQEETVAASPPTRLAARIAATIESWLQHGERLPSQDRAVRAGDILILVRRRRPFAPAMVAALKARGIPVAGADRLRLTEQIAVKDLVSLGTFLTLPENDLALAEVLKSPLFGLDDDDLVGFANARKGTLWSALIEAARTNGRLAPVAERLRSWRRSADQSPPFEFFAQVLDRDGGRQRLVDRLGAESIDAITEFLDLALAYDEAEPPSLTGFLEWLMRGTREIKRDMEHGRDEVRVLTVHGSKGLEAPIVFLADTCSARSGRQPGDLLELAGTGLATGLPPPMAWPVKGASRLQPIAAARQAATAAEAEERNRLLYVAMTRARDRLYVTGFEGSRGRDPGCWYDLIADGLDGLLAPVDPPSDTASVSDGDPVDGLPDDQPDGRPAGVRVRRLAAPQEAAPETSREAGHRLLHAEQPPEWSRAAAPRERQLAIPLAPSRLAPYDIDDSGEPIERPATAPPSASEPDFPSPLRLSGEYRFLRGTLTHALFEHLPTLDPATWHTAAAGFVESRGAPLRPAVRDSIVSEALAVLHDPRFAAVFGPDARAEVPIVAEIPRPDGDGLPLRLNGQIDRLVVTDREVLIVDYKTNRPPPADVEGVASAYLYQLAAYRMALSRIYPDLAVVAAILWTDGARLMPIPGPLLDRCERELWQLDRLSLDAE